MSWTKIEKTKPVPKDQLIWIYQPRIGRMIAKWHKETTDYEVGSGGPITKIPAHWRVYWPSKIYALTHLTPTHWMHLPEPPEGE